MGLFSDDHEWHSTYKKSWWDGSRITWCGMKVPASEAVEPWITWGTVNCTNCKAARKAAGKD